eukprot:Sdes_comp16337_c0_seq1m5694
MSDENLRSLKIKCGIVKRLNKEIEMYNKEAEKQRGRISRMKDEGKDEYDIKKQYEVLQETLDILPDVQKRLEEAKIQLVHLVKELRARGDCEKMIVDCEEFRLVQPLLSVSN